MVRIKGDSLQYVLEDALLVLLQLAVLETVKFAGDAGISSNSCWLFPSPVGWQLGQGFFRTLA